jgi:hypothetical protein
MPTDLFTLVAGAWIAGALRFPAFLIDGPAPKLSAAALDESASVALVDMGTTGIIDFSASSMSGM